MLIKTVIVGKEKVDLSPNQLGSKSASKADTRTAVVKFMENPALCTESEVYEIKSFYDA